MSEIVNSFADLLKELATDQGKEIIVSVVTGIAKRIKNDIDWKKLFVDSGKRFIDSEEKAGHFIDELSDILSKKSLKDLAKELRSDSGYGIEEKALEYLVRLMSKYDIPHDRAIVYSKNLLAIILENIRDCYPEKYDRVFQSDWRNSDVINNKLTQEKLDTVSKQLKEYKDQGIKILSSDDIDQYLLEKVDLPFFGVSFFEVDDTQFCEYLSHHREDERLYVKCKCKEEAIYCIINELWHQKEIRPIFVVKNEDSWDALRKINNSGNIYIPDFWADEIIAIPNNTNIFVLQENFPLFSKNYIELRPRTRRTLLSCLERAGMDYSEASELISKNHGLFTLMKRKLINGLYQKSPEWVGRIPISVIKTCLLICSWKDNIGDKLIIEELSGYKYEDFIGELQKYSKGDDPFVVISSRYEERYYSLANIEDSWLYYNVSTNEEVWKKFIDIFSYVMTQDEKLLTYESSFEKTIAEMNGEKLEWSGAIRSGMVHAIMVKTYYIGNEECQQIVDELVQSILNSVTDVQQWRFISNYFKELCELSPVVVLSRLSKEFDEPTGMIQLFDEKVDDFMWGTHYYINILWGLEQFLLQKEYASLAFDIVLRLDNLGIQFKANSPKETIRTVLCVWGNFSAFDTAEYKVAAAKRTFKIDNNAWDIIYSVLPDNQQTVFGSFVKPLYRDYINSSRVLNRDLITVVNEYLSLLVKNALFDTDRWTKLLESADQLPEEAFKTVISSLKVALNQMDDLKKTRIKDSIREIIHKHRFFNNASWAMDEERIAQYEELLDEIIIKTPEFEYAFYFNYPEIDYPLMNPHVHNDEDYLPANERIAKELIKEKMREFQDRKLDLYVLASCCALRERVEGSRYIQSYLGRYLAYYWNDGDFDSKVFSILLKAQRNGHFACDYYAVLGKRAHAHFDEALALAKVEDCDSSVIISLYQTESQFSEGIPAIDKAEDGIKKAFWSQFHFGYYNKVEWALNECSKFGTCGSFVRLLYCLNEKNHFNPTFLYNCIMMTPSLSYSDNDRIDTYYLSSLLKQIQDNFMEDEEKRIQIAKIEFFFSALIDWNDMRCLQYEVKKSPDAFVDVLAIIYKTDDDSVPEVAVKNKEYRNVFYQIYSKMEFCPAEENGYVDEEKLFEWIKRFDELLKKNKQNSIRGMVLGRLLSYSPAGSDGFFPCEAVRKVIEVSNDQRMLFDYRIAVENNRGAYWGTEGRGELALSEQYKQNADYLSIEYPKTASIYYGLADSYRKQAIEERRQAENAF